MRETRICMGMPITVEIADAICERGAPERVFAYFRSVDERFSTYKDTSEITRINRGEIREEEFSDDMKTVLALSRETKALTDGFFDIRTPDGRCDPSGLVKGWAIFNAAKILEREGYRNFFIDAGGDIQTSGRNKNGAPWRVGIRNPFRPAEIVKALSVSGEGVATSGTYERGQHIYNPKAAGMPITAIVSITVVAENVYEADRFATAAFAMGDRTAIAMIEKRDGCEGYLIEAGGAAVMTAGFSKYVLRA